MSDSPEVTVIKIKHSVRRGLVDDYLTEIMNAVISRRRTLAAKQFASLKVGDTVTISEHIKPRYMAGQQGVIVEKRQTKVEIEFDEPMGRFGRRVIVPSTALEVI